MTPYRSIVAITPSNTVDLAKGQCAAIWCAGTGGNVAIVTSDGEDVVLPIASGFDLRLLVKTSRVKATGTTATTLYACYI